MLQIFKIERNVVFTNIVQGDCEKTIGKECVCGRLSFIEQAFVASSLLNEFSTIANSVRTLESVLSHETLDVVLHRMLTSGFDEVCVVDDGIVVGVLNIDEVYSFLTKELSMLGCELLSKHAVVMDSREASEEDQTLVVQSISEIKADMEKKKTEYRMSPLQVGAQQFSKGYWTEFLLIICITLDVTSSVVEYLSTPSDSGTDLAEQKLEVSTCIILFVFAYEALVRIYGFRMALLYRPFELIDLSIVLVSVIVYCLVIDNMVLTSQFIHNTLSRIYSSKKRITCAALRCPSRA